MWRKSICAVGGLLMACAAAYYLSIGGKSVDLELGWLYAPVKQDRLPVTKSAPADAMVMAFRMPARRMTIVAKGSPQPRIDGAFQRGDQLVPAKASRIAPAHVVPSRPNPIPANPGRSLMTQQKPLEGCEPSFSPVVVPALAHVIGRCLS